MLHPKLEELWEACKGYTNHCDASKFYAEWERLRSPSRWHPVRWGLQFASYFGERNWKTRTSPKYRPWLLTRVGMPDRFIGTEAQGEVPWVLRTLSQAAEATPYAVAQPEQEALVLSLDPENYEGAGELRSAYEEDLINQITRRGVRPAVLYSAVIGVELSDEEEEVGAYLVRTELPLAKRKSAADPAQPGTWHGTPTAAIPPHGTFVPMSNVRELSPLVTGVKRLGFMYPEGSLDETPQGVFVNALINRIDTIRDDEGRAKIRPSYLKG